MATAATAGTMGSWERCIAGHAQDPCPSKVGAPGPANAQVRWRAAPGVILWASGPGLLQAMNAARPAMNGARRLLSLTLPLTLLSGCGPAPEELRGTAYLAISVEGDQPLTKAILQEEVLQAQAIVAAFRQLHPHVAIETNLLRESSFIEEVRRRQVDPDSLQRLEIPADALAGLPILWRPQLACFNRARLANSPTSTDALISQARRGLRVGLAVESRSLFWSASPLGADRAILAAAAGRPLAAGESEGLRRWLAWLSAANFNQKAFIVPDQEALVEGLLDRRLDWIPCNSGNLAGCAPPWGPPSG